MKSSKQTLNRAKRLRKDQTPAEQRLWAQLRAKRLNTLKFKRQKPIGPYIVDFCSAQKKLVIEIDGESHLGNETKDQARTTWLEAQGYTVIRFTNLDVYENLDAVLNSIIETIHQLA